ncbi:alanine racemase [Frankia casuarinae]|uniref:Alanine racemase n=1 Tax=Frankia casuarinae (strain DSM 45818 / CECT 9043 / HFP020203 / CcI3) TaxID=106370 RepID=ALR_FRACC|nr:MULTISPECIES: alanine racemase [Frankia]Q2JFD6.1 RecName: Full=Alanine racemase [Frankia casuarinae]ABD10006.1 alanine racemase [Frankia casuarinae]ETA04284.1 alanine racemase [Frankia sp. CcI6]EYT92202.1 alanine racemase [Frankia casuarinae]KDA45043.1 alanine racemase [Frankia sp. BMG5.23]OAA22461.1 alanine racemase [Frankia casuarinae]
MTEQRAGSPAGNDLRSCAVIDLDAVRTSVTALVARAGDAATMAVVKADGYGHGMIPCARAALEGGATWLGTAFLEEALALRAAGFTVPVLSWLAAPGESFAAAIAADVDLSASAGWALEEAAAAARRTGRTARVHLKADTGLGRAGATEADWPALCDAGAALEAEGVIEVIGVWSHFAFADAPGHPTVQGQIGRFRDAIDIATKAGLHPSVRHLANSAATLVSPEAHFDLVRPGVSVYGLSPGPEIGPPAAFGLRPAMTLTTHAALTKRVPAGTGVSYAHRYTTTRETTLAVVPLGYADGIPRSATNTAEVLFGGRRRRIAGTVCMDQFVLDVGDDQVAAGDEVLLFGPGDRGEPTADDWAAALGTINYEIVSRVGARVPRRYV